MCEKLGVRGLLILVLGPYLIGNFESERLRARNPIFPKSELTKNISAGR